MVMFLLWSNRGPIIQLKLVHSFITEPEIKHNLVIVLNIIQYINLVLILPSTTFEFLSKSTISVSSKPSREAVSSVIRYLTFVMLNLFSKISNTFSLMYEIDRFSNLRSPQLASHQRIFERENSVIIQNFKDMIYFCLNR